MPTTFVSVAKESDIPEGEVRVVVANGRRVALCRVEGRLYAVEDVCTHDDGPLGEGRLHGCAIECPRHGARFDVRTGEVLRMPAAYPVRTFPVRIEGGDVRVGVE
jgi:3-phenylpropionate/trans-cinnamate dioxygenase ferredoxin subunit